MKDTKRRKRKKRNPRRAKRILLTLAILLVLAAGLAFAAKNMTIREMTVEGNIHYTKEEIRDILFPTPKEQNMIYSYLNYRFGEKIQIPFVENYTIEFSWPHRVDVIVYEKNVVGYTEYMGRYMYFDKDGIIVESSSEKTEGIPLVTGLQFGHIILYEPLPVEDQDVFEEILNLTQLFEKYNLSVDKIYFDSNYHAVLYMGDLKVRLGDSSLLDGKIAELADMLPVLADKGKGTLYLDQYSETAINSNYYFKKEE